MCFKCGLSTDNKDIQCDHDNGYHPWDYIFSGVDWFKLTIVKANMEQTDSRYTSGFTTAVPETRNPSQNQGTWYWMNGIHEQGSLLAYYLFPH